MGVSYYFMALLIDALVDGNPRDGLLHSVAFGVCVVGSLLLRHSYIVRNSLLFINIRQAITALLYENALKL